MNRIVETGPARETLDAEVVVIGAGIAGGLMAYELAKRKHKVTILDAGPVIDRVEAVKRFRATAVKGANSPYETAPYAPYPDDEEPF